MGRVSFQLDAAWIFTSLTTDKVTKLSTAHISKEAVVIFLAMVKSWKSCSVHRVQPKSLKNQNNAMWDILLLEVGSIDLRSIW